MLLQLLAAMVVALLALVTWVVLVFRRGSKPGSSMTDHPSLLWEVRIFGVGLFSGMFANTTLGTLLWQALGGHGVETGVLLGTMLSGGCWLLLWNPITALEEALLLGAWQRVKHQYARPNKQPTKTQELTEYLNGVILANADPGAKVGPILLTQKSVEGLMAQQTEASTQPSEPSEPTMTVEELAEFLKANPTATVEVGEPTLAPYKTDKPTLTPEQQKAMDDFLGG